MLSKWQFVTHYHLYIQRGWGGNVFSCVCLSVSVCPVPAVTWAGKLILSSILKQATSSSYLEHISVPRSWDHGHTRGDWFAFKWRAMLLLCDGRRVAGDRDWAGAADTRPVWWNVRSVMPGCRSSHTTHLLDTQRPTAATRPQHAAPHCSLPVRCDS